MRAAQRDAEVEAQRPGEVGHELLGEASVQAVRAPQLLDLGGAHALGALAQQGQHRVAGREPDHAEDQEDDAEQDRHQPRDALRDVSEHDESEY